MHKRTAGGAVALIAFCSLIQIINAQRGPPPPGHYNRGPPPRAPPHGLPGHGGHPFSPYKINKPSGKPSGPSKIMGWLGSQMSRLPGFRMPNFSKQNKFNKPIYKPGGPPPQLGAGGPPNTYHSSQVIFSHPSSSPFGVKPDGAIPENIKLMMGPTTYYTTSSTSANEIYQPGKEFSIPPGYESGPTVYKIVSGDSSGSSSSSDGSNGYLSGLPPGFQYQIYNGKAQISPSPNLVQVHDHDHNLVQYKYVNGPPPPPSSQPPTPPPPAPTGTAAPPPETSMEGGYTGGPSEIVYQHVPAQKIYSPAPDGFYKSTSSGNMEVLPSKMISYEKETISTGHPQYQNALNGMSTSASHNVGSYPFAFTRPAPFVQQQQQQNTQAPENLGYIPHNQEVQRADDNLNGFFSGISPEVAPLYDLSSLDLASSSGGIRHGENGAGSQVSPSTQHQTYAQAHVPETVSLDDILASFGKQYQDQNQNQGQDQIQSQEQTHSLSQLYGMDTQADYSHPSVVAVPPPRNFNFDNQQQQEQNQQQSSIHNEDQSASESQNDNGVKILSEGSENGQSVFQVFADANAPTFEGGHPFDINQLISMIEPGAQIDPQDIVAEAGSENHDTFASPQVQEDQSEDQTQDEPQNEQKSPGDEYTIIQQGTNSKSFNSFRNPPKPNSKPSRITFPDSNPNKVNPNPSLSNANNTNAFKSKFKTQFKSGGGGGNSGNTFQLASSPDLMNINTFQKIQDGGSYKDKGQSTLDLSSNPSSDILTVDNNNDLMTFGPSTTSSSRSTTSRNTRTRTVVKSSTTPSMPFTVIHTSLRNSNPYPTESTRKTNISNQSKQTKSTFSTTTTNPLANTRIFSYNNSDNLPLIYYHTIKPSISSNKDIIGENSRNLTFLNKNTHENPNHNYKATTNSKYPSQVFSLQVQAGGRGALPPTVNPFFDSVEEDQGNSEGFLHPGEDGDLAASDSRQVKAYAITVTPPSHMFLNQKKLSSSSESNTTPMTEISVEPSTISINNISSSLIVTPSGGAFSKNSLNSSTTTGTPTLTDADSNLKLRKFPIYQHKSHT